MSIGKMGRYECDECGDTITGEVLWAGWGHMEQPGPEAAKLHFCGSECMDDHLYGDVHAERKERELRDVLERLCEKIRERYGLHLRLKELLDEIL